MYNNTINRRVVIRIANRLNIRFKSGAVVKRDCRMILKIWA